jgi:hypothetical protein
VKTRMKFITSGSIITLIFFNSTFINNIANTLNYATKARVEL